MSVKHFDYCREVKREFYDRILTSGKFNGTNPITPEGLIFKNRLLKISDKIDKSVKFILPPYGITVNDSKLKALDDDSLELPFPIIALEYEVDSSKQKVGQLRYEKSLVLVEDIGSYLEIHIVSKLVDVNILGCNWLSFPWVKIPKNGLLGERENNLIKMRGIIREDQNVPIDDYNSELMALLDFLNALSCRNVHIEKSKAITPSVRSKSGKKKKIKTTIPYDDYHYLTVDVPSKRYSNDNSDGIGDRRTPREHLRRGHIRRYSWGKIWINATVVNPGIGNKVDKIYKLRNREGGININTR